MDNQNEHHGKGKTTRKELKEYLSKIEDYANYLDEFLNDPANWDSTTASDDDTDISSNPTLPPPPPPGH